MSIALSRLSIPRDLSFWNFFNEEVPRDSETARIFLEFQKNPQKKPETYLEHIVCHDALLRQRDDIVAVVQGLTQSLLENEQKIKSLSEQLGSSWEKDPMLLMEDSRQARLCEANSFNRSLQESRAHYEKKLTQLEQQRASHIRSIQRIEVEQLGEHENHFVKLFIEDPEKRYCDFRKLAWSVDLLRSELLKQFPQLCRESQVLCPSPCSPRNTDEEVIRCMRTIPSVFLNEGSPCGETPSPKTPMKM